MGGINGSGHLLFPSRLDMRPISSTNHVEPIDVQALEGTSLSISPPHKNNDINSSYLRKQRSLHSIEAYHSTRGILARTVQKRLSRTLGTKRSASCHCTCSGRTTNRRKIICKTNEFIFISYRGLMKNSGQEGGLLPFVCCNIRLLRIPFRHSTLALIKIKLGSYLGTPTRNHN